MALNWKKAQQQVLNRLEEIRRFVNTQDESSALELINMADAFCDNARIAQSKHPETHESNCHFCEGYVQSGGCMDRLDKINHAILHGKWTEASRLIDDYIVWIKNLQIPV